MTKFLVLSFSGQESSEFFEHNFLNAGDENTAYEILDEESFGFVTNILIAVNKRNVERLRQILKEISSKK